MCERERIGEDKKVGIANEKVRDDKEREEWESKRE